MTGKQIDPGISVFSGRKQMSGSMCQTQWTSELLSVGDYQCLYRGDFHTLDFVEMWATINGIYYSKKSLVIFALKERLFSAP